MESTTGGRYGRKRALVGAGLALAVACAGAVGVGSNASADQPTGTGVTGYTVSVGKATTVAANSAGVSVAADAFCRPGKVVLSGGIFSHSKTTYIRTSYPTDSLTWQVVATPTVNVSYPETITAYAICVDASSVPGYVQEQSAPLSVGPATYYGPNKAVGEQYCPSGDVVVGGGVRSHNPSTFLSISTPTSDQRAWEAAVDLTNPPSYGGEYYQVSAICVSATDFPAGGYNIVNATTATYGTGFTQAAPSDTAGSPYCAAGQLAIAAGGVNHDSTHAFLSSVEPTSGGKYWLVTATDTAVPSYGDHFLPVGLCVTGSV